MKLKVIIPIIPSKGLKNIKEHVNEEIESLEFKYINYELEMLEKGTASLEGNYDETINGPEVVKEAQIAEEDGFDAVIVDCFAGPGVDAAREKLNIPVIHPGESSIHLASLIGQKFSIVDILEETAYTLENLVRKCGLSDNFVSRPYIDIPVLDFEENIEIVTKKATNVSINAINNGANVIVLGCTGMMKVANKLESELEKKGYSVPVIEPFRTSVAFSRLMTNMELTQSKRAYPKPRKKKRDLRW